MSQKRELIVDHGVRIRLLEVAEWYDKRSPDSRVALDLFDEFDGILLLIGAHPEAFPIRRGTIRRVPFKTFPFALDYRVTANAVSVVQLVAMAGAER